MTGSERRLEGLTATIDDRDRRSSETELFQLFGAAVFQQAVEAEVLPPWTIDANFEPPGHVYAVGVAHRLPITATSVLQRRALRHVVEDGVEAVLNGYRAGIEEFECGNATVGVAVIHDVPRRFGRHGRRTSARSPILDPESRDALLRYCSERPRYARLGGRRLALRAVARG